MAAGRQKPETPPVEALFALVGPLFPGTQHRRFVHETGQELIIRDKRETPTFGANRLGFVQGVQPAVSVAILGIVVVAKALFGVKGHIFGHPVLLADFNGLVALSVNFKRTEFEGNGIQIGGVKFAIDFHTKTIGYTAYRHAVVLVELAFAKDVAVTAQAPSPAGRLVDSGGSPEKGVLAGTEEVAAFTVSASGSKRVEAKAVHGERRIAFAFPPVYSLEATASFATAEQGNIRIQGRPIDRRGYSPALRANSLGVCGIGKTIPFFAFRGTQVHRCSPRIERAVLAATVLGVLVAPHVPLEVRRGRTVHITQVFGHPVATGNLDYGVGIAVTLILEFAVGQGNKHIVFFVRIVKFVHIIRTSEKQGQRSENQILFHLGLLKIDDKPRDPSQGDNCGRNTRLNAPYVAPFLLMLYL